MSYFIFFYLVSLFFLKIPLFFAACFQMPVVSPAHGTDAVAHSWSGKQAMREEKILMRFCSPAPLFTNLLH